MPPASAPPLRAPLRTPWRRPGEGRGGVPPVPSGSGVPGPRGESAHGAGLHSARRFAQLASLSASHRRAHTRRPSGAPRGLAASPAAPSPGARPGRCRPRAVRPRLLPASCTHERCGAAERMGRRGVGWGQECAERRPPLLSHQPSPAPTVAALPWESSTRPVCPPHAIIRAPPPLPLAPAPGW
jgi:hypothetical protein